MLDITKKLSKIITPKPAAKKSTSKTTTIPMMIMAMATLSLGTFASVVGTPAEATLSRDLPITIPNPPNGDNGGRLAGSVLDCLEEHPVFPSPDFAIFDCIRAVHEAT